MTEFEDEIEGLRKRTKALLIKLIQDPASLFNRHLVSFYLGIPLRKFYRLTLPDSIWLPSLKECEKLTAFLKQIAECREFWPELIRVWSNTPEAIKLAYFPRNVRGTLDDDGLTTKEKVEQLTVQTMRILRRLMVEEAEEEK